MRGNINRILKEDIRNSLAVLFTVKRKWKIPSERSGSYGEVWWGQ